VHTWCTAKREACWEIDEQKHIDILVAKLFFSSVSCWLCYMALSGLWEIPPETVDLDHKAEWSKLTASSGTYHPKGHN